MQINEIRYPYKPCNSSQFTSEWNKRKRGKKNEADILKENSKYSKSTLTLKQIASYRSCHELESAKQKLYKRGIWAGISRFAMFIDISMD